MKDVVSILSKRAEKEEASSHLRLKNIELELQVRSQSKEIFVLNKSLSNAEERIKGLEMEIHFYRERIGSSRSVSVVPASKKEGDHVEHVARCDRKSHKDSVENVLETVNTEFNQRMGVFQEYEERIVNLMEELVRIRSGLRDGSVPPVMENGVTSGGGLLGFLFGLCLG